MIAMPRQFLPLMDAGLAAELVRLATSSNDEFVYVDNAVYSGLKRQYPRKGPIVAEPQPPMPSEAVALAERGQFAEALAVLASSAPKPPAPAPKRVCGGCRRGNGR